MGPRIDPPSSLALLFCVACIIAAAEAADAAAKLELGKPGGAAEMETRNERFKARQLKNITFKCASQMREFVIRICLKLLIGIRHPFKEPRHQH